MAPLNKGGNAVEHPPHYNDHPSQVECIEVVRHLTFNVGSAVKYVWRRGDKGRIVEDLNKALFYLDDAKRSQTEGDRPDPGSVCATLLDQVVMHESNQHARGFYLAIRRGDVVGAMQQISDLREFEVRRIEGERHAAELAATAGD